MPTMHLPRQTTIYTCGAACLAAICALLEAGSRDDSPTPPERQGKKISRSR